MLIKVFRINLVIYIVAAIITIIFLLLSSPDLFAHRTFAQQEQDLLIVSPSYKRIDLSKDQPQTEISFINNTQQPLQLSLTAEDFYYLEEGYKLQYFNNNDSSGYPYKLSDWIQFDKNQLSLNPKEEGRVTVFIDEGQLSPGSHYASILAEVKQSSDQNLIGVQQIISSLLFVRTNTGKEIESAQIGYLSLDRMNWEFPFKSRFSLKNTGTVDLIPYGILSITNPVGKQVSHTVLNEDSLHTAPDSTRHYQSNISLPGGFLLPGIYHASINLNYGKLDQNLELGYDFLYLERIHIIITVLVITLIFSIIIRLKLIKRK